MAKNEAIEIKYLKIDLTMKAKLVIFGKKQFSISGKNIYGLV
jgi:hypothetical protein